MLKNFYTEHEAQPGDIFALTVKAMVQYNGSVRLYRCPWPKAEIGEDGSPQGDPLYGKPEDLRLTAETLMPVLKTLRQDDLTPTDRSLIEVTFEDYENELSEDFDDLIMEYFERTDPENWSTYNEYMYDSEARSAYFRARKEFLRIVLNVFIEKIDAWLKAGGE